MGHARGKLVLKPIINEKSRRVTFEKRKKGLVKKASELSTLCGVDVCMVCYGPDGEPKTWPKDRSQVLSVIERYNNISKDERDKRKQDITTYIELKNKNGNSEFMYPTWGARLDECSEESLKALGSFLDDKLEKVRAKIEFLKVNSKAPKNPKEKDVMVDDFNNRDRMLCGRTAKIELSNYYGDVSMNNSYGGDQYHYHWRVPGMATVCNPGYGMMDLMVINGDAMRDYSYNLSHSNSSMFHHQPPALRMMMPMPMQMPMPMPMHPPPPQQQQQSMPMEAPMPLRSFHY